MNLDDLKVSCPAMRIDHELRNNPALLELLIVLQFLAVFVDTVILRWIDILQQYGCFKLIVSIEDARLVF